MKTIVCIVAVFASDGLPMPQYGSKMAHEGPERSPGEPHDGPRERKSDLYAPRERPKWRRV
eukprot:12230-Pyramimonas_sp.AAC.1